MRVRFPTARAALAGEASALSYSPTELQYLGPSLPANKKPCRRIPPTTSSRKTPTFLSGPVLFHPTPCPVSHRHTVTPSHLPTSIRCSNVRHALHKTCAHLGPNEALLWAGGGGGPLIPRVAVAAIGGTAGSAPCYPPTLLALAPVNVAGRP